MICSYHDILLLACELEIFRQETINSLELILHILLPAIIGMQCQGLQM